MDCGPFISYINSLSRGRAFMVQRLAKLGKAYMTEKIKVICLIRLVIVLTFFIFVFNGPDETDLRQFSHLLIYFHNTIRFQI